VTAHDHNSKGGDGAAPSAPRYQRRNADMQPRLTSAVPPANARVGTSQRDVPTKQDTCSIPQHVAGVAARMLDKIFLVVFLCRIEFPGGGYLRHDRAIELAGLVPPCLHTFRSLFLRVAGVENGRAILRADVVVLPVRSRGIVHSKEIV